MGEKLETSGECSLEIAVATIITLAAAEKPRSEINLPPENCNMCIGASACRSVISVKNGEAVAATDNCLKKAMR